MNNALSVDTLCGDALDVLCDSIFKLLLRICFSGIVWLRAQVLVFYAPTSRRSDPAPIRSRERSFGISALLQGQTLRLQSRLTLCERCVTLLLAVFHHGCLQLLSVADSLLGVFSSLHVGSSGCTHQVSESLISLLQFWKNNILIAQVLLTPRSCKYVQVLVAI